MCPRSVPRYRSSRRPIDQQLKLVDKQFKSVNEEFKRLYAAINTQTWRMISAIGVIVLLGRLIDSVQPGARDSGLGTRDSVKSIGLKPNTITHLPQFSSIFSFFPCTLYPPSTL